MNGFFREKVVRLLALLLFLGAVQGFAFSPSLRRVSKQALRRTREGVAGVSLEISAFPGNIPVPLVAAIQRDRVAGNNLEIREFALVPLASSYQQAVIMNEEVLGALRILLQERGLSTETGERGGFIPELESHKQALELLVSAIKAAGYIPGKDFALALDIGAGNFIEEGTKTNYLFEGESRSSQWMLERYQELRREYPIISLKDPFSGEDIDSWKRLEKILGDRAQIVAENIGVESEEKIGQIIAQGMANAFVLRLNKISTITEALKIAFAAENHPQGKLKTVISYQAGESLDSLALDFAVAVKAEELHTAAPLLDVDRENQQHLLELEKLILQTEKEPQIKIPEFSNQTARAKTEIVSFVVRRVRGEKFEWGVEVEITLKDGSQGSARVPANFDPEDTRGTAQVASTMVNNILNIAPELTGMHAIAQEAVDKQLIDSKNINLSANAISVISMAVARATANSLGVPLYQYLRALYNIVDQYTFP